MKSAINNPYYASASANAAPVSRGNHLDRLGALTALAVLCIYVVLAVMFHQPVLEGDEIRYHDDATHLTQGWFISDENPRIYNGPGYPLVLAPLVAIDAPLLAMRMLGPLMVGLAAWFLWLTGRRWMSPAWTLAFVLFCSFQPSLLRNAHLLMTEAMTHLCAAGFMLAFLRAIEERVWFRWALVAGLILACWAMTRVVMGHVIVASLVACVPLILWRPSRAVAIRSLVVMSAALLLCTPYLGYTQKKAGSPMMWSSTMGEMFYWMSSHEGGENGLWYDDEQVYTNPELNARHGEFLRSVTSLKHLDRQVAMKEVAMQRIKENPRAILSNWACNVTRLFFGFPRSLEREKLGTLAYVVLNGGLMVGLVVGLWIAYLRREPLPWAMLPLVMIAAFYIGGSTLAPSIPRYLQLILPVLSLLTFSTLSKVPWSKLAR